MRQGDKYATRLAKRFAVFTFLSLSSPSHRHVLEQNYGLGLGFIGPLLFSSSNAGPFTFNRLRLDDPRLLGLGVHVLNRSTELVLESWYGDYGAANAQKDPAGTWHSVPCHTLGSQPSRLRFSDTWNL